MESNMYEAANQREVVEYYDRIADTYDSSRFDNSYGAFIHKQELAFLDRFLGKSTLDNNLDLGCGTGRFLKYAHHGIDPSSEMLAVARRNYPNKNLKIASGTNTGFDDLSFTKVYSFHVMMHIDKQIIKDIISESHRILKPKGQLIIDFPSHKRRQLLKYKAANWHGATSFNVSEIEQLVDNNFKVVYSRGFLFLPVHLIPVKMRFWFFKIDQLLCRSFLKPYSSYIAVILEKI
ncbi:MAG: class I SAM-dependent methyltransferase [Nonlabens sp.]|uniref:class I SAM-dependent methyltransferase n=1 Tax=Nonlabens sp. TaxID=1888209 RepID=UPI003EF4936F